MINLFRISFAYGMTKLLSFMKRLRAMIIFMTTGAKFKAIGTKCKIRGAGIIVGSNVVIGDFCWIEAVNKYKKQVFNPLIQIGDDVAFSDFVHISAIKHISIGNGTLIGSKVYIGDHSHGNYKDNFLRDSEKNMMPKDRPLADEAEIIIGKNCWIGDGAVVLAGTRIGDNCIIGANSVIKGIFSNNILIAGLPAKVVKEYK